MINKIPFSNYFLSLLSGIIIGLAYLPYKLGFLSYIGFIPIFHIWSNNNSSKNGRFGFIFGFTYNIISNYWIAYNSGTVINVAIFSLIITVIYLAFFWCALGFTVGILKHKINSFFYLPFLVVLLEWVRGIGPLGYSWGNLALTQTDYTSLIQCIEYGGTHIISFLIISINIFFYFGIIKKRISYIFFNLLLILGLYITGTARIKMFNYSNNMSINVAVIQPNVDPNEKWDYSSRIQTINFMDSLHTIAVSLNPELIIFPETALPAYLRLNKSVRSKIQSKVDNSRIPVLIGTVDRIFDNDGKKIYYNSSMYLKPNRDFEVYSKIHLVPFAEYDLLPNLIHPLEKLNLNIDRGVFKPGKDYKVFKDEGFCFSNLICFESSIPNITRKFVDKGAQFITIQANDGWLGTSAGPYQHFELARLRAIENRIFIIRSSNTGISGVISPNGEVIKKIPLGVQSVFIEKINLVNKGSYYSIYGDIFAKICTAILLIMIFIRCVLKI